MAVAVDVSADHLPGLLEGLELVQPDAALPELRWRSPYARVRVDLGLGGQFGLPSAQIKDAFGELGGSRWSPILGEQPQLGVLPGARTEAKRRATALDNDD